LITYWVCCPLSGKGVGVGVGSDVGVSIGIAVAVGAALGEGVGRTSPAGAQAVSRLMAHRSRNRLRIDIDFIGF